MAKSGLTPHYENGVVVVRIPKKATKNERAAALQKLDAMAKKYSMGGREECADCGAKLKLSKKGNQYCGELCWLKK